VAAAGSPTSSVTGVCSAARTPSFLPARNGAASALPLSLQGDPSAEMAMVLELLTVTPSVRIWTGTQHPSGAFWGTWKSIWSSPAKLLRPL